MTLKETISALNAIAMAQPDINDFIPSGNVYDINKDRDAKFSVFCVTQGTHRYDFESGINYWELILYYVDRLTSDGGNKTDVQSTGIEVLKNIIRTFDKDYDADINVADFVVFTESFAQLCAGCYTTITIETTDDNNCVEYF